MSRLQLTGRRIGLYPNSVARPCLRADHCARVLLACGIAGRETVGKLNLKQIYEIAVVKQKVRARPDPN